MSGDAWPLHPLMPVVPDMRVVEFANPLSISPMWGPPTPLQASTKLKPWPTSSTHGQQPLCDKSENLPQHADPLRKVENTVKQLAERAKNLPERLMYSTALRHDVFCQPAAPAVLPLSQCLPIPFGHPSTHKIAGDLSSSGGAVGPVMFTAEGRHWRAEKSWQQKQSRQRKIKERAQKNLQKGQKGVAPPARDNDLKQSNRKRSATELESQPTLVGLPHRQRSPDVTTLGAVKQGTLHELKTSVSPWTPLGAEDEQRARNFSDTIAPQNLHAQWQMLQTDDAQKNERWVPNGGSSAHSRALDGAKSNKESVIACQNRTPVHGPLPDQRLVLSGACNSSHTFDSTVEGNHGRTTAEDKAGPSCTGDSIQERCTSSLWNSSSPISGVDNSGDGLSRSGECDEHGSFVSEASKMLSRVGLPASCDNKQMQAERQEEPDGNVQSLSLHQNQRQGLDGQDLRASKAGRLLDLSIDAHPEGTSVGHPKTAATECTSVAVKTSHSAGSEQGFLMELKDPSTKADIMWTQDSQRPDLAKSDEHTEGNLDSLREQSSGSLVSPTKNLLPFLSALDTQQLPKTRDDGAIAENKLKGHITLSTEAGQELYAELKARSAAGKVLAPFQLRFIKLQEYLVKRDLEDTTQLVNALHSMTREARGVRAAQLEHRAVTLALDEAREMGVTKQDTVPEQDTAFSRSIAGPCQQAPHLQQQVPSLFQEHPSPSQYEPSRLWSTSRPDHMPPSWAGGMVASGSHCSLA